MRKILVCCVALLVCSWMLASGDVRYNIIPQPQSLKEMPGEFKINSHTVIEYPAGNTRVEEIATDFCAQLSLCAGLNLQRMTSPAATAQHRIVLKKTEGLGEEEYRLGVTPQTITITATTPTGFYYGIQTIYQLLPVEIYGNKRVRGAKWVVPCCEIQDAPRFAYRGLMLDVGRYYMPKEFVLKFIDIMAMHKQNYFHWHLTEDQGWRIEIKKYPLLTEIGSVRKETAGRAPVGDGKPHGGFYTQEEVREVVEYARRRCITVIPEIELPGHSMAAIAAYPELSCFPDREYEVATTWGIKPDVYCPTAVTFRFLEDVFTELFDLFPSKYYHIGGDECPKDRWKESEYCQDLMKILGLENEDQLQIFFMQRIAKFLEEKGSKTLIGWDEILDGGAIPEAIVLSYRGHAPAMRAADQGIYTIMTPNRWCYLDNSQDDPEASISINEFMPLEKVYNYFPVPETMHVDKRKYIIGQQGSLWTENIPDYLKAESFAYPRAIAMSEVAWTDKPNKDWYSFRQRMLKEFQRLDVLNVNYSKVFWNVILGYDKKEPYPRKVRLFVDYPDSEIRYTINGANPTARSIQYTDSITVNAGDVVRAQGFLNGKKIGNPVEKQFK